MSNTSKANSFAFHTHTHTLQGRRGISWSEHTFFFLLSYCKVSGLGALLCVCFIVSCLFERWTWIARDKESRERDSEGNGRPHLSHALRAHRALLASIPQESSGPFLKHKCHLISKLLQNLWNHVICNRHWGPNEAVTLWWKGIVTVVIFLIL